MTSKEAITILKEERLYLSNNNANEVINAIEKDLEVLKALKKYLIITTNLTKESQWLTFYRHIFNDDFNTKADFYLIKEWLENDK